MGPPTKKKFRDVSDEDAMSTQQEVASPSPTTNTLDFEPYVDAAVPAQFSSASQAPSLEPNDSAK